ncbi:MAG: hypothetical protein KAW51_10315 [Candidatus Lokiarchaeota archaeon]|nr:hypothetical protein [Candidatus Lokiarchaeota archaeon]MCK4479727.1 hypothetical protein [Candidatus Lokiarchaeota archaeon]
MVNRTLDYGFNWTIYQEDNIDIENHNDSIIFQQLTYFNEKNKNKKGYIKALYLHHLLDFFKETYVNIYDMDLVFKKFLQDKVLIEIMDSEGNKTNFQEEIQDIFQLLRENKEDLYIDLKGEYFPEFEKSKNKKQKEN